MVFAYDPMPEAAAPETKALAKFPPSKAETTPLASPWDPARNISLPKLPALPKAAPYAIGGRQRQEAQSSGLPYTLAIICRLHHAACHIEYSKGYHGIINTKEIATGVCVFQRIVQTVVVSVEVLAVVGHLHIVVRTEEPTPHGVVQPPVHVDDVELAKHLVPRVAAVQPDGIERYRLLAPRIVGGIEDLRAVLIHNAEDAP